MDILCAFLAFTVVVVGASESNLRDVLKNELLNHLGGGKEIELPDHKIVGGWSATTGLIPYQVFIRLFTYQGENLCGGSLISRKHVLTAAHCLPNTIGAIVTLGSSTRDVMFGPGIKTFLVEGDSFVVHPDYDDEELKHDIAIIRLPSYVVPSFTIRPIALPTQKMTTVDYFAGKQAVISGFGKTTDDFWDMGSEKLLMAHVNITKLEYCQRFWKKVIQVNDTQVCSSSNGTSSTCQGDSGGPLAVTIADKRYLVGITSFGDTRCLRPSPSVYTNVASYLGWIKSVVAIR